MAKQTTLASPCIGVCELHGSTGFCKGCARTMDEIVEWPAASRARRLEILQAVSHRRRQGFRSVTSNRRVADES
jgi:hypothetical protein